MAADKSLWPDVQARDVMKTEVVTISETAPLIEAVRRLADHRISGMPVTNEAGHLSGVLSIRDVLDFESEEGGTRVIASRGYFAAGDDEVDEDFGFDEIEVAEETTATVADAMTAEVYSVEVDVPILDVVTQMVQHRIHRVLVKEKGKYVGLISTMDVMSVLVNGR